LDSDGDQIIDAGEISLAENVTVVENVTTVKKISNSKPTVNLISAGEPTTSILTFEVQNELGNPMDGVCLSFLQSGTNGEAISPSLQTLAAPAGPGCSSPTVNGQVSTTFTSGTTSTRITVTGFLDADQDGIVGAGELNDTDSVFVQKADSIRVKNISSPSVALLGSGGDSTSAVSFEVLNELGQLMDNVCVSFTLENGGIGGGESVNPGLQVSTSCSSTTSGGAITTSFRGGTKAGTVNIIAFLDVDNDGNIDSTEIKATATVAVNGGPPFGNHLEVGTEKPNKIVALNGAGTFAIQGATNLATFFLSDRFTNPVPDQHKVTFRTFDPVGLSPAATVDGSGETAGGTSRVTAETRSQNPVPSDGIVDVIGYTQGGADASVLSLLRTGNGNLYAGTDGGGVFRSFDNGDSWNQIGLPDTGLFDGYVRQMVTNPQSPNEIFVVTNRGVYRSPTGSNWGRRDGSQRIFNEVATPACSAPATTCSTWTVSLVPESLSRTKVEVDGVRTRDFYFEGGVGSSKEIHFTVDVAPTQAGEPALGDPREVALASTVSVSYDLANHLPSFPATTIVADPRGTGGIPAAIPPVPAAGRLWVGLRGAGIYRSDNGGLDWSSMNTGLTNVNVQDLAYDPTGDILYVATEGGGVYSYSNPANSQLAWTQRFGTGANTLLDLNATNIDVDSTGGFLLVGTKNSGVQYSTDQGVNWLTPPEFRSATPRDVEVSKVLALSATSGVALTLDDEDPTVTTGNLWVTVNTGANFTVVGGADPFVTRFNHDVLVSGTEILVAGRGRSVNRSTNSLVAPFAGATFADATGLLASSRIGNGLFAGTTFMYGGPLLFDFYLDPSRSLNCDIGTRTVFKGGYCGYRVIAAEAANDRPMTQGANYRAALSLEPDDPAATLSGSLDETLSAHFLRGGRRVTEYFGSINNAGVANAVKATLDIQIASDNGSHNLSTLFTLSPNTSQDGSGVSTSATQLPDSIFLVGASAQEVALLGSGGASTSILTFEVRNEIGQPMDGICLSFTLENGGIGGGESVNPNFQPTTGCASKTLNGQITTSFRGGTKAGTVNVIAFLDADGDQAVDGDEIKATATVSVNSGPPFGNHFGMAVENVNKTVALNSGGTFSSLGIINTATAFLSDRFTNPVPDGTVVTFRTFDPVGLTPAIQVDGSSATAGGNSSASANTRSQNPAPNDGIVDVLGFTQGGADATVLTLLKVGVAPNQDLYAGTDGGGIFRSSDNGQSWTLVGEPDTGLFDGYVREMIVNPRAANEIFAVTNRGVYFSPTGSNWTRRDGSARIFNEVPTNVCGVIACDRWDLSHLPLSHARTDVRIDGGRTRNFHITNSNRLNLTDGFGTIQTVDPATQTISVSYDNANFLPSNAATSIVADTRGGAPLAGRLWVGFLGAGVYHTQDGGISWNSINSGLTNVNVHGLAYDSTLNRLYAATEGGGVFVNTAPDATVNGWAPVNGTFPTHLLDLNVTAIDIDSASNLLVVGTKNAGVLLSSDGGTTWNVPGNNAFRANTPPDVEVSSVRVLSNSTVLALTLDDENQDVTIGDLWLTTNTGATFAPLQVTGASATTTSAAATFVSRFNQDVLVDLTAGLGAAEILVGGRGRSVNRITNVDLATPTTAATGFVDATGVLPSRIGNQIFGGVTFMYGGPLYINTDIFYRDPSNSSVGCNLASGLVPVGEFCGFRFTAVEAAHDRPLAQGATIKFSTAVDPTDAGAVVPDSSLTLDAHNLFSMGGVAEFYGSVRNTGVTTPVSAVLKIEVTSDNGVLSRTYNYRLTP
jgi:ligand-binding sensor domain-containing protein